MFQKLIDAAEKQVKLLQQMGNMPSQRISWTTTFTPGLPLQNQIVGAMGQPFQNHPSIPPHPYQPQYYGPIPPTTPTNASTESGASLPLNPPYGPSFIYNHQYPHPPYPVQNHHHSPQYYRQYYQLPPGQSPLSYDQYGNLLAGSSVNDELNKADMKNGRRHDEGDSPRAYGRISLSTDQVDDSEIPVQQLAV